MRTYMKMMKYVHNKNETCSEKFEENYHGIFQWFLSWAAYLERGILFLDFSVIPLKYSAIIFDGCPFFPSSFASSAWRRRLRTDGPPIFSMLARHLSNPSILSYSISGHVSSLTFFTRWASTQHEYLRDWRSLWQSPQKKSEKLCKACSWLHQQRFL